MQDPSRNAALALGRLVEKVRTDPRLGAPVAGRVERELLRPDLTADEVLAWLREVESGRD